MSNKPSVIMPTPDYGNRDGNYLRDKLVQEYGETTVMRAEISICIQLLMMNGIIKASDFVELLRHVLQKNEDRRRSQAGFRD